VVCRGVSSFNTFLTEYDSDSGSGSEPEYASGVEDNDPNSTVPPSPSSESSHLSRAGSSGRRHRRSKTLLERLLLWMLWPLRLWSRLWYVGSSALNLLFELLIEDTGFGMDKDCGFIMVSGRRSGNPETRRSNSGGLRRLARRWSGSREFAVPKSVADRRRGIIEVHSQIMCVTDKVKTCKWCTGHWVYAFQFLVHSCKTVYCNRTCNL
jgi:hypothetical protein